MRFVLILAFLFALSGCAGTVQAVADRYCNATTELERQLIRATLGYRVALIRCE